MKIICKITSEITDSEIEQIYKLFFEVFQQKRDIRTFREEYSNTPMGYSYHSILLNEANIIVGFHSCMPFYYFKDNERFIAALGIDSMVKKEYRDYFSFHEMIKICENRTKEDGCVLRIGFPNDTSYPILKKGLKHKDIGHLTTYCMIRNIGGIKPSLSIFNPFSRLVAKFMYLLSFMSNNNHNYVFKYRKDEKTFNAVRYKWFDQNYNIKTINGSTVVYKIKMHEGVDTAFLLDVYPLSKRSFYKAIREIYKKERKNIDMILYVGNLPFKPLNLITIPHKFEPKHFNFTCKPLDSEFFDNSLYDINNWAVNLSNYDLL